MYQIGLMAKRDLNLAPNMDDGFEMAMLRMLSFLPDREYKDKKKIKLSSNKKNKTKEEKIINGNKDKKQGEISLKKDNYISHINISSDNWNSTFESLYTFILGLISFIVPVEVLVIPTTFGFGSFAS